MVYIVSLKETRLQEATFVKNIHPAYRFRFRDLTQVNLRGFQILMAQDYLGHDF